MLSQRAKYALRALVILAERNDGAPVLISEIADSGSIPKKFLEQILLSLRNEGILRSRKGRGGGYLLARPAQRIRLGEVIRHLDGPLAPLPCVSRTAYRKCDDCEDETTCGIHIVMWQVREETARILDGTSLADLVRTGRRARRRRA
jgi:Rrf2 family protein